MKYIAKPLQFHKYYNIRLFLLGLVVLLIVGSLVGINYFYQQESIKSAFAYEEVGLIPYFCMLFILCLPVAIYARNYFKRYQYLFTLNYDPSAHTLTVARYLVNSCTQSQTQQWEYTGKANLFLSAIGFGGGIIRLAGHAHWIPVTYTAAQSSSTSFYVPTFWQEAETPPDEALTFQNMQAYLNGYNPSDNLYLDAYEQHLAFYNFAVATIPKFVVSPKAGFIPTIGIEFTKASEPSQILV